MKILTEVEIELLDAKFDDKKLNVNNVDFQSVIEWRRVCATMLEAHRQKRKAMNRRKALSSLHKAYDRLHGLVYRAEQKLEGQIELNEHNYQQLLGGSARIQELEKKLDDRLIELHEPRKAYKELEDEVDLRIAKEQLIKINEEPPIAIPL